jgi:hypothetical protein
MNKRRFLSSLRDLDRLGDLTPWRPLRRLVASVFSQQKTQASAQGLIDNWLTQWWFLHPAVRNFYCDELKDYPNDEFIQDSLNWLLLTEREDLEVKQINLPELNKRWYKRYKNKVVIDLMPTGSHDII